MVHRENDFEEIVKKEEYTPEQKKVFANITKHLAEKLKKSNEKELKA
jgi:hypothetical protein